MLIHLHKITLADVVQLEAAKVVANEKGEQLRDVAHERHIGL